MSSLDPRSALVGAAALAAALLTPRLARQEEVVLPAAPQIGRYQIAIGENLNAAMLLDTSTGASWRVLYVQQADQWVYEPMGLPRDIAEAKR